MSYSKYRYTLTSLNSFQRKLINNLIILARIEISYNTYLEISVSKSEINKYSHEEIKCITKAILESPEYKYCNKNIGNIPFHSFDYSMFCRGDRYLIKTSFVRDTNIIPTGFYISLSFDDTEYDDFNYDDGHIEGVFEPHIIERRVCDSHSI